MGATRGLRACAALVGLSAAGAAAGEPSPVFELGRLEVRGAAEVFEQPYAVEVLGPERLFRGNFEDLAAALTQIPGIAIQDAGQRRERLLTLRGFSNRQVPLFIDGIPVYVPYDGVVDLSRFGIEYVGAIEVHKGLASVLLGPNILGGAVNVISRRPVSSLEGTALTRIELDDRFEGQRQLLSASVGGTRGAWYAHGSAALSNLDGYRLPSSFQPVPEQAAGRRANAAAQDLVISAKLGYVTQTGDEYALSLYRQDGEKQSPPYAGPFLRSPERPDGVQVRFWRWPEWNKQSVYFTARNAVTGRGTLRWRLFYDAFDNRLDSFDDNTYTTQTRPFAFAESVFDDDTRGGNADFEWRWNPAHTTRTAVHYREDIHRQSQRQPRQPQTRLDQTTWHVGIEHEWRPASGWSLTPGYAFLRQPGTTVMEYDRASDRFFPITVDPAEAYYAQLVARYGWDPRQALTAGVSRKTRFPTLKDRFSGGLGSAVPNPALEPESALHWELGYERRGAGWQLRGALFYATLEDAIENVTIAPEACSNPPCRQLRNVGEQRNQGVELSGRHDLTSEWTVFGHLTWLDRENRRQPEVRIIGVPATVAQLSADWRFDPAWALRLDGRSESSRFSNSNGTRRAEAFTLLDATLRHAPRPGWGVELGIRNLGDRLYAFDEGFFQPGRTWFARLDWRFGTGLGR